MINIHRGRICGYLVFPLGKVSCQFDSSFDERYQYCSFTTVFISVFTLTNRTQHRGAKQLCR